MNEYDSSPVKIIIILSYIRYNIMLWVRIESYANECKKRKNKSLSGVDTSDQVVATSVAG